MVNIEYIACIDWKERLPEGDPIKPTDAETDLRRRSAVREFDELGTALIRLARTVPLNRSNKDNIGSHR